MRLSRMSGIMHKISSLVLCQLTVWTAESVNMLCSYVAVDTRNMIFCPEVSVFSYGNG